MAKEHDEDEAMDALRLAVWHAVAQTCEQEGAVLGVQTTNVFIATLAELCYQQLCTMGKDAELFANHAKRSVISMDDIKLFARRNDGLYALIQEASEKISQQKSSKKRRK